ncbi:hypothetical protein ACHAWU_003780 [Discostella pseudostelligera]|uniref:Glycosyltransferase family 69 protein n=1 Tax=Discostella pseudostelligera TaxID=259834 RepID=A0ABD3MLH7_9STRA
MKISARMAVIAVAWPILFLRRVEQLLRSYSSSTTFNSTNEAIPATRDVDTVLIIATVPYSANHVMALWTQLECVTDGIDRVLISAPDTLWSKEIIAHVIKRFTQLSNTTAFTLEAVFHVNNRYDAGLWCDGLDHINARNTSTGVPRAVFLINDSATALRRYDALTNRIINATHIEHLNMTNEKGSVKLISLNGDLINPGNYKTYWVESVYRGLTPDGTSIFYQHSCSNEQRRACVGKRGSEAKDCIVDRFEMAISNSYAPSDLESMFPSFPPKEWNYSSWEAEASKGHGPILDRDHWLNGRQFFWYLREVHDFPFRKLKWPNGSPPPVSQCLELLDGNPHFDNLPFPSNADLKAYQAEMYEAESLL